MIICNEDLDSGIGPRRFEDQSNSTMGLKGEIEYLRAQVR
jgi:hypothetical protein